MFCADCGLEKQQAGAYCRRCGSLQPYPMRAVDELQRTKSERTAGAAIGAISLVSAVMLIWTLRQPDARYEWILAVAMVSSLLVAAYHAYNLYLGYNAPRPNSAPDRDDAKSADTIYTPPISALDQGSFDTADLPISSVTEHTTRTLEPVERQGFNSNET